MRAARWRRRQRAESCHAAYIQRREVGCSLRGDLRLCRPPGGFRTRQAEGQAYVWAVRFAGHNQVQETVQRSQAFLQRHWQRLLRWRRKYWLSEPALHLVLAGAVGVLGGLVNLFFFYGIESAKLLFLRRPGDPVEIAEMMGDWERLIFPTLGGLLAGLILFWGLRLVRFQGPTNLLEVVVAGDGRLQVRPALVKSLSSLISIGTGASIGQEGAITQMTATLASRAGQWANSPPYRLRLLLGCGAAAGIAAAYNAPIAGAVFAAMVVLGNFAMTLFAPLVFASVVAAMVSRSFFGIRPRFEVPGFDFTSITQLPWFVVLGVLTGILGALFLKLLRRSEQLFRRLDLPIYLRLAAAGFLVGAIALVYPAVWGNGYFASSQVLQGRAADMHLPLYAHWPVLALLGLLLAKLVATTLTVGAGTVGGLFTPTLFLGAVLGCAFGLGLHEAGKALMLPVAAFGLVGMGGVLAATTHSPLLALIMVFEISLNYSLMPPLMLACVVSVLVARRLHPDSVYTEPLAARGLNLMPESDRLGTANELTVGDLMRAPVPPVRETAKLSEVATRFLRSTNNFIPVVDAQNRLVGVVALQDLKEHLSRDNPEMAVIAYDIMRPPPPCVTPNQKLLDVLPLVIASEQRNIPVVNSLQENRLVGSLPQAELLGRLSEVLAAGARGV